ncbi:hypothetical protein L604_000600002100 [Bacillus subtilis J27]|nr:hypothetical protein L604_000600002100 [Bacillus subtilis J27]
MKVIIIEGPQADKCMNDCYHYLIKLYRQEIQGDSNIQIDITEPEQINFERIAETLDIRLSFKPVTSFALKHSGIYNICLDSH